MGWWTGGFFALGEGGLVFLRGVFFLCVEVLWGGGFLFLVFGWLLCRVVLVLP